MVLGYMYNRNIREKGSEVRTLNLYKIPITLGGSKPNEKVNHLRFEVFKKFN